VVLLTRARDKPIRPGRSTGYTQFDPFGLRARTRDDMIALLATTPFQRFARFDPMTLPAANEPISDHALVAAMARGNAEALSELYDRYSGLMMAVGLRVLSNRAMTEDLVHDVFLEAWRVSATYDRARGTVKTWLLIRLRSRALDRVRSAAVSRRVDHGGVDLPEPDQDPRENDPTQRHDRLRIRRIVAQLPEVHREVIELAYFQGLSGSEISERLGLPLGTVKSRTAAGLSRLRATLDDGSVS
jgi:RNA polymerase sigma-70 factor (ECF subfamily)